MKTLAAALTLLICLAGFGRSQNAPDPKDPKKKPALKLADRHGFAANPKRYPQNTPKDTLESIIKAIVDNRLDYMMAHLADPEYVDGKVAEYLKASTQREEVGASAWALRIGIFVTTPEELLIRQFELPKGEGLLIEKIIVGSPGAKAGMKEQDILLELRRRRVSTQPADLLQRLRDIKGDVTVDALVIRRGRPVVIRDLVLPDIEGINRQEAFRKLVRETTSLYREDAVRIQELRNFARNAEWKIEENQATGSLKQLGNRQVFLKLDEERWFLENRQTKEK